MSIEKSFRVYPVDDECNGIIYSDWNILHCHFEVIKNHKGLDCQFGIIKNKVAVRAHAPAVLNDQENFFKRAISLRPIFGKILPSWWVKRKFEIQGQFCFTCIFIYDSREQTFLSTLYTHVGQSYSYFSHLKVIHELIYFRFSTFTHCALLVRCSSSSVLLLQLWCFHTTDTSTL